MKQAGIPEKPIFILGIMYRSGTNFLHDLICLHPDCREGGYIKEDFLVSYSSLLVRYANNVYSRWNPRWQVREMIGSPETLVRCMGDGLIDYLNLQLDIERETDDKNPEDDRGKRPQNASGARLVTKTPSVVNMHHFHKLFPGTKLVVVIRDGRAVVESGVRSFNWKYEDATQRWKLRAQAISELQKGMTVNLEFLLVRYEDLVMHTEKELKRVLSFAGLDEERYDFKAAIDLPVKGSSDIRKHGNQSMHWKPVEKPAGFDPLARFKDWGARRHARFDWVAGKQLDLFGYERISDARRLYWLFPNLAGDMVWQFSRAANLVGHLSRRARKYLKRKVG